ncbi:MAG: adenosylmethionine decarboxylase [Candidatus Omnitrophica bacterium]|nr:S-adenosylmethionine decarboxylase proenzyme [bacterium]NUN95439.1 adenosylmethionine decarboxylase [Candidatus Omnitrophota bacterium]
MITAAAPLMVSLGKHWIIECYECNPHVINSPERLEEIFLEAAQKAGATIVGSHFHSFEPQGVSGVVVIAESHFSVHSWPEHRYAAVDVFTCGESIDVDRAMEVFRDRLETEEVILAGDLNRGVVSHNGLERASAVSINQVEAVLSWREKFEREEAWGILTSVDVQDCDPDLIRDADYIKRFAVDLCEHINMKRYGDTVVVHFGEDERVAGFSLVQLIETSLVSGHFANATNAVYIDIFSCKYYDPQAAADFTRRYFNGRSQTMKVALRK